MPAKKSTRKTRSKGVKKASQVKGGQTKRSTLRSKYY